MAMAGEGTEAVAPWGCCSDSMPRSRFSLFPSLPLSPARLSPESEGRKDESLWWKDVNVDEKMLKSERSCLWKVPTTVEVFEKVG